MNYIDYLKEGSGIHIKKKNRGKFTKSAQAAGEGVQEHAHKIMNDPNATPLQRKRANFAIQAKKWHKHFEGGIIKASHGAFINTGRTIQSLKEREEKNREENQKHLNEFDNSDLDIQDLPEQEKLEKQETTPQSSTSNESLADNWDRFKIKTEVSPVVATTQHDKSLINEFLIPTSGTETTSSTTASKNYIASSKNENRERLRAYLKRRGLDDTTVEALDDTTIEALLVQAGAESGYNHQIKNPNSSAYGLGQWVKANHLAIIDHVNQVRNKQYTDISQLDLDDQAEALAWWYYDRNKQLLDSQLGTYNKVKALAKIGLAPAIVSQGSYTWGKNGKTYRDTDEDWLAWFVDTGHDPNRKLKTFDDHIADRYRHAGYSI